MKILDFFKKGFALLLIFFVFSGFSVNSLFSGSAVSKEDINTAISIMNEKRISSMIKPGNWHKIDLSKCKYLQFNKTVDGKEKVQAVYSEKGTFVIVRKDRKLEDVIQLYYISNSYGDGNISVDDKYIDFTNTFCEGSFLVNLKYKTARVVAGYVYPGNDIQESVNNTTWISSICFKQKKVEYSIM